MILGTKKIEEVTELNRMKEVLKRVEIVLSEGMGRSEKEVCDLLDATNMNHAMGFIWAEVCKILRE